MALESATYLDELVTTNPTVSDTGKTLADHIWLLKTVLQTTFPNVSGAVSASDTELSYVDVTTIGTAQASKAVVLDASKDITGLGDVSADAVDATTLKQGGTAIASTFAPIASPTFTGAVTLATSSPSADLEAASKGYVDTQIAALGGGMNNIQTDYELISSWTSGSGEDTNYFNVTLGEAVVVANCVVILHAENGAANDAYPITGRVTSTTNLRIACQGAPGTITVRWYVLEYS